MWTYVVLGAACYLAGLNTPAIYARVSAWLHG